MKKLMSLVVVAVMAISAQVASATYYITYNNDSEFDGLKKATYYGWMLNGAGAVIGDVSFTVPKPNSAGQYKVKSSVVMLTRGKKISFSGTCLKQNTGFVTGTLYGKNGESMDVSVSQLNSWGTFKFGSDTYLCDCGRDFSTAKGDIRASLLQGYQGQWVFAPEIVRNSGTEYFNGAVGLSVKISAKGVAKVTGTLPDGYKFSSTTHLVLDDNGAFLPIFGQLYSGKQGGFGGFIINLDTALNVTGTDGYWNGTGAKSVRGGRAYYGSLLGGRVGAGPLPGKYSVSCYDYGEALNAGDINGGIGWYYKSYNGFEIVGETLPNLVELSFAGTKFTPVVNPCKLKLSYKAKTGVITGSYQINTTAGKKFTAKVNGVFVNGNGWVNGTTKDKGGMGLVIY